MPWKMIEKLVDVADRCVHATLGLAVREHVPDAIEKYNEAVREWDRVADEALMKAGEAKKR